MHVDEILARVPPEQGQKVLDQARRLGIVPNLKSLPEEELRAEQASKGIQTAGTKLQEAVRDERFLVEGYACPSCAWLVSVVLLRHPGVSHAQADFMSDSVRVTYDMRRCGPDELVEALRPFGYQLHLIKDATSPEEAQLGQLLRRFVFALFLALNVMMLSGVHWASYLEFIPPVDLKTVALIQLVLILPLIGLGVWPLFKRSLGLFRLGRSSMDLLFVLGFSAACFLSVAGFFYPDGEFYFDSCAAFVAISLLGRLVEAKLRFRAVHKLRTLLEMPARKVAVLKDSQVVYIPTEQVGPSDQILVEPGQVVPFDGMCASHVCVVSEAMLTGEPTPVLKHPGDTIWAGSTVMGDSVEIKVLRSYRQGRLQQITNSIAQSLSRNELRLRSADRLAAWFVPGVLLAALATLALRLYLVAPADPLSELVWMPTVAVLLIACPCAFGIAAASALAVAVSTLLEKGILVKDGSALERFSRIDQMVFDKTGTLTTGLWKLQEIRWIHQPNREILRSVAGAEAGVDHPVAHTLQRHLVQEKGIRPVEPDEKQFIPGKGVLARFAKRHLAVGSSDLFESVPQLDQLDDRTTVVYFGFDRRAVGCFLLADAIRKDAAGMVAYFRSQGIQSLVLSGDRQPVVKEVARQLGIAVALGELSPEAKRERVIAMAWAQKKVCFAGDGSNDAPAMTESEVAISLRHGTDLSLSVAHILPLSGDLEALPNVFQASRLTLGTLRRNFGFAFVYNLVFLPLAALGYLHPIFAAGLMFASSISVLLHSLRLKPHIEKIWEQTKTKALE